MSITAGPGSGASDPKWVKPKSVSVGLPRARAGNACLFPDDGKIPKVLPSRVPGRGFPKPLRVSFHPGLIPSVHLSVCLSVCL